MPTVEPNLEKLWLRAQGAVYELIEKSEMSRTAVSQALSRRASLVPQTFPATRAEAKKVPPAFDLAFEILELLGEDPAHLVAWPPVVEKLLPHIPTWGRGKVEDATRPNRTTKAQEEVQTILEAARSLEGELPRFAECFREPWRKRRDQSAELDRAYERLEDLERRRHYEPETVAEECREVILRSTGGPLDPAQAVQAVGCLGIWGTIKRVEDYLRTARDTLTWSIRLARTLGDESLLGRQLQRSYSVFRELDEPEVAVGVLDQASRHFRVDQNEVGAAKILVDLGVLAGLQNDLRASERFYRAALDALPTEGQTVNRSCAAQGVATCLEVQGDLAGAADFLQQSAKLAEPKDPRLCAALTWLGANLERKLGISPDSVEAKYWNSIRAYEKLGDSESVVLACLDLAVFLVEMGDLSKNAELRQLLAENLPRVKHHSRLECKSDLILLELSRKSTSAERLRRFARELERCGGGAFRTYHRH